MHAAHITIVYGGRKTITLGVDAREPIDSAQCSRAPPFADTILRGSSVDVAWGGLAHS